MKLTATEFAALKAAQQYSAYDDAMNASLEARSAQGNALADHQASLDEVAKIKADNDAAIKKLNDEHTAALQEATDKAAEEIAAKDAELTTANTTIKDQQALIDSLGGTELGQKLARQKERERLAKEVETLAASKAAAEAKLAELPIELVEVAR